MTTPVGIKPFIVAKVFNEETKSYDDLGEFVDSFVWSSFINSGYSISANFFNIYHSTIHQHATRDYLKHTREKPVPISFKLGWKTEGSDEIDSERVETPEFLAYISDMTSDGIPTSGKIGFNAIDPASYILSHGSSSGRAWRGNVSKVIRDVIADASSSVLKNSLPDPKTGKKPNLLFSVSETNDNKSNVWHQMRMDPATFINSLLEWSSSTTNAKSEWIVASGNKYVEENGNKNKKIAVPAIFILQWPELLQNARGATNLGTININSNTPGANDALSYEFLGDNFISVLQTQLTTQGISSVSGLYIDKSDVSAIVNDARTPGKLKPHGLSKVNSYTSPKNSGSEKSTSIIGIPEFSGGELGIKYQDFIDGRPRNTFLNILNSLFRIKVKITGWHKIGDSTKLGVSTVDLGWQDIEDTPFFLNGKWILYGFKHIFTRSGGWFTELFLSRIEHDAVAIEIGNT